MRIEWATLCKFAETSDMGTTIVDFGQGSLMLTDTPTNVQVHFAMCLTDMLDLPAIDVINIRILSPSGSWVAGFRFDVAIELVRPDEMPDGVPVRQGYSVVLPFTITDLGTYVIELATLEVEPVRLSLVARMQ